MIFGIKKNLYFVGGAKETIFWLLLQIHLFLKTGFVLQGHKCDICGHYEFPPEQHQKSLKSV